MKDRILKHWKTSLIGVIFIVFGGVGLWFAKIDLTASILFVGAGLVLLGIKDPFTKNQNMS